MIYLSTCIIVNGFKPLKKTSVSIVMLLLFKYFFQIYNAAFLFLPVLGFCFYRVMRMQCVVTFPPIKFSVLTSQFPDRGLAQLFVIQYVRAANYQCYLQNLNLYYLLKCAFISMWFWIISCYTFTVVTINLVVTFACCCNLVIQYFVRPMCLR